MVLEKKNVNYNLLEKNWEFSTDVIWLISYNVNSTLKRRKSLFKTLMLRYYFNDVLQSFLCRSVNNKYSKLIEPIELTLYVWGVKPDFYGQSVKPSFYGWGVEPYP